MQKKRKRCRWCAVSPEFAPFHWECFEIFRNWCSLEWADALRRLWVAAAWRTPWRGASPMPFPIDAASSPSLESLCIICELPQLYKLPLKLLQMIQSYSEHALLWRGAIVCEFTARISKITPSSLLTMPLRDIVFWERGKQPQVTSSLPPLPLIRIVVDAVGISKVERISVKPYKGECSTSCVYMVEQVQAISKYNAQFKNGFLRLELASSLYSPAVWNTPNPPDLQLCRAYEKKSLFSYRRFFAVKLASIRGITFFFSSHQLYGVHIHRSSALCALPSLQRVPPRRRRSISWCYLPIANHDRIVVLGVRISPNQHLNLLVRMEKAGDVIVGPYIPGPAEDLCLGWHAPITLVHREPQEGQPVPYFGAYCHSPTRNEPPKRFQVYKPSSYPLGEDAYLSIAPLEGIRSVEVFYVQNSRHCRGMVLYYQNGCCRAVGQCRIHVDSAKKVMQPLQICFRMDSVSGKHDSVLYAVQVDWRTDPQTYEEEGWNYKPLKGNLLYWYTYNSSFIVIEK
ncbi:hypothetical protein F5X97DRAFT_332632 [Nemania serpens]|nr:hypothetical protein F5X97DRAFT_332632 [Nemania serpens]